MIDITNEELNTALYLKMYAEQQAFRDTLLQMSPEEILHNAYEYTQREDILLSLENNDLSSKQCEALLKSQTPLADVFRHYESQDFEHMEDVLSCVEGCANKVLRADYMRSQSKER